MAQTVSPHLPAPPPPGQTPLTFPWGIAGCDRSSSAGFHAQQSGQNRPLTVPPRREPPAVSRLEQSPCTLGAAGPQVPAVNTSVTTGVLAAPLERGSLRAQEHTPCGTVGLSGIWVNERLSSFLQLTSSYFNYSLCAAENSG